MLERDTSNFHFQLAADFVNQTSQHIFLTGKAGTGKTTFLRQIKEKTLKNTVILAPTGVAAINAGGATLHSFFQLPFGPYVPAHTKGFSDISNGDTANGTDKHALLGRVRFQKEKRELLQQLDLMIIDEVSMVRSDTLDAIDTILRHFRRNQHQPFGGVQVLFIGDLFQLPPVMPDEEWQILQEHYQSPFFFDSWVVRQHPPLYIELEKIYRQNEQSFIDVLNKVRNNAMDQQAHQLLHTRYDPAFEPPKDDNYILLTTHNFKADTVNASELNKLSTDLYSFEATVTGDFNERSYPAEKLLQLKPGAQVMFIKNDLEKVRRYFNGKIGVVSRIEKEDIYVQCNDSNEPIKVNKEVWRNIRYSLDKSKQKVEEEEMGSFTQYPLRLAWAITIHKSQGLTFEKAVIDAGAAFAPGQVYVALSRCTSLQGMVLHSRINAGSIFTDERVVAYSRYKAKEDDLEPLLFKAKYVYQCDLLKSIFDVNTIVNDARSLQKILQEHASSFNPEAQPWTSQLKEQAIALQQVAKKFQGQLHQLLQDPEMPELNEPLQQRVTAAAKYFIQQIEENLLAPLKKLIPETDSKQNTLLYREAASELYKTIVDKLRQFQRCKDRFSMEKWVEKKADNYASDLHFGSYGVSNYAGDNPHADLFQQLRTLRNKICEPTNLPIYLVAGATTLDELSRYLPLNIEELSLISGFGPAKLEKYGPAFLEVIQEYCERNGLESRIQEKILKKAAKKKETESKKSTKEPKEPREIKEAKEAKEIKEPKKPTRIESFDLFKTGKTIPEIAALRNLTIGTIENHLSTFIPGGELDVYELVPKEKLDRILPMLERENETEGQTLTAIKEKLGEDVSFGEIRMAIIYKNR